MCHLIGPDLTMYKVIHLSELHDIQRFVIDEFLKWTVNTDGEDDLRVK